MISPSRKSLGIPRSSLVSGSRNRIAAACIEALEDRRLLSAPVINTGYFGTNVGIAALKSEFIPLRTDGDTDGNPATLNDIVQWSRPLKYTVTSSNAAFKVKLLTGNPYWKLTTNKGTLVFQLFKNIAPKTVSYITGLTNAGYYNNLTFHRIADLSGGSGDMRQFIIQGGDPQGTGSGGPGFSFEDEFNPMAMFTGKGQLAMANSGADTNGSQFFITTNPTRHLDFIHTIFGQLVRGGTSTDMSDTGQPLDDMLAVGYDTSGKPNSTLTITKAEIIQDYSDAVINVTAPAQGNSTITVKVDDGHGGVATKTFAVHVDKDVSSTSNTKINEPSFLSPVPTDAVTPEATPYSMRLYRYDFEKDTAVWGGTFLNGNNAWAVLEGNMLTIVPFPGYKGPIIMKITATESGSSRTDSEIITLGVGDAGFAYAKGIKVTGTSGVAGDGVDVATFSSLNASAKASDFTASINWGDSQVSTGTIRTGPNGTFVVHGSNAYKSEGKFPVNVQISSRLGAIIKTTSSAVIGDAPLTASDGTPIYGTEDASLSSVSVGSFTDADFNGQSSDFTGTVDWGDGSTSAASISGYYGSYSITGTHTYANPGTYDVKVSVQDKGGSSTTVNSQAIIGRSTLTVSPGSSTSISEGAMLDRAGSFADTVGSSWSAEVDYGDGSTAQQLILNGKNYTLSHVYPDSGSYTVRVTVTDQDGITSNGTFTLTVSNVAPTLKSVTGDTNGVQGQARTVRFTSEDISPADTKTGMHYTIDWGDGTSKSTVYAPAKSASHSYSTTGTYTVKVVAIDKDNGQSAEDSSHKITITKAELQNNTEDNTKKDLVVGGTSSADTISVFRDSGNVKVKVGTETIGPFDPADITGIIQVYGYLGNDKITVESGITIQTNLFGGDGNDTLVGGGGNDLLVGGAGNDDLDGAAGWNVVFGGAGSDTLDHSAGSDILVAGSSKFTDPRTLRLYLKEWARDDIGYAAKVAHLTGTTSGGLNSKYVLNSKMTPDDGAGDLLDGGSGNDLFVAHIKGTNKDVIRDRSSGESVVPV